MRKCDQICLSHSLQSFYNFKRQARKTGCAIWTVWFQLIKEICLILCICLQVSKSGGKEISADKCICCGIIISWYSALFESLSFVFWEVGEGKGWKIKKNQQPFLNVSEVNGKKPPGFYSCLLDGSNYQILCLNHSFPFVFVFLANPPPVSYYSVK